jgi:hypothetical protein
MRYRLAFFSLVLAQAWLLLAPVCCAQIMFPGGGITLGGKERTITGHIGSIDTGKIMVRSLESGNVLFTVDEKTKIHVDKTPLTIADLKEDDPVAVRIKDTKNKGPYALEIMAHPDVLARKRGAPPEAPPSATELPASPPVDKAESSGPAVKVANTPASTAVATGNNVPQRAATPSTAMPLLPRGQSGITGTIVALKNDEATLQMSGGQQRTVLVTSVTKIHQASSTDKLLDEVRVGDMVAVVGDSLDTGLYVAREIIVNRGAAGESPAIAAAPQAEAPRATPDTAMAVKSDPDTKSLMGTFTGVIETTASDSLQVRTADGRLRNVVVTPLTAIKKWNADTPLGGLRKGDEIKVVGDLLDDGGTLARELTVTKAASSK